MWIFQKWNKNIKKVQKYMKNKVHKTTLILEEKKYNFKVYMIDKFG